MKQNKTLYRIVVLSGFFLINAAILFGISQITAYLNTGADRSKMLHIEVERQQHYIPEVIWESIENPGRPIDETNKNKIEQDYLDAWYAKNIAFYTGNDSGLVDHYTKNACQKIGELLSIQNDLNTYSEITTLSHHLTLEFYSTDGTLAVLTDRNVNGIERIFKDEQFKFERPFDENYKIILLLEDGFWKIRHFEKIATNKINTTREVTLDTALLEGMNYYPKNGPWDTFGANYSSTILSEDFKIINDLKLNCIRVFVGYADFGKAQVSEKKLNRLQELLDIAEKADLKVIITLFDFYGDYHMHDWTLTNKHLNTIVSRLKNHSAILAWDMKNEPDLDFETRGKREVCSWLTQSITYLKQLDTIHPVTIGWSSPENALNLNDSVDFISYHYYSDIEGLSSAHSKLTKSTIKPVILQELGLSSYKGIWSPFGNTEKDQVKYYEDFFKIQKRDSIDYLSWTLYDFNNIPTRVAGSLPWRKNKQAFFGVIDTLGVKDDAYCVIKNR